MAVYKTTRVYKDVVNDIKRVNMLRGGTRSTKSFSLTQLAARWLWNGKIGNQVIPEGEFFILRESFPALRRTVLKDFINILSRENMLRGVNHVKTTHEFKRGKRTVSFFSADDESKIHGPQNTIFWINEATAVKYNIFFQLFIRCSHFCFLDYNPINSDTWPKEMEEGKKDVNLEDITLDISTVHDNPFLTPEQMDAILGIKDIELKEVYLKGNWTKLTGLVFPDYTIVDRLPGVYDKRYFAVDFGWVHPFVLLEFRQIGMNVYIHEHVFESEYDYSELHAIRAKLIGVKGCADSADPRSIKALRDIGFKVKSVKKPKIVESIRKVRQHNLFITSASEGTIKQISTYKRRKNSDDQYIEEPQDFEDDAMDAIRYGINTFSQKRLFNFI